MTEKLMTLTQASRWLHEELGVTKPPSCLWRWVTVGVDGTRLEAVSIGQKWHTSAAALRRFISACTQRHGEGLTTELVLR